MATNVLRHRKETQLQSTAIV